MTSYPAIRAATRFSHATPVKPPLIHDVDCGVLDLAFNLMGPHIRIFNLGIARP